ncbi:hypothetical protein TL16_g01660 [Triparma laevis f. inornata]|nr:hypothetical protein TL16_g01660 [Triparma laevis f. inornata]
MSKSVASESNDHNKSMETSKKRGSGDEGDEDEEGIIDLPPAASSTTLTTVPTVPATTDQFMFTPEFGRQFVDFVPGDTMMTLRLATKGWNAAADAFIDEGVETGQFLICDERSIDSVSSQRRKLVMRVIFHLNIVGVGERACWYAVNLVLVDIPEGVKSIDKCAFGY